MLVYKIEDWTCVGSVVRGRNLVIQWFRSYLALILLVQLNLFQLRKKYALLQVFFDGFLMSTDGTT